MLTRRGATVLGAGVAMWMMSRLVGSPGLEVVGIGLRNGAPTPKEVSYRLYVEEVPPPAVPGVSGAR